MTDSLDRDVKDARKLVHDLITDLGGNLDADTRARLEGLEAAIAERATAPLVEVLTLVANAELRVSVSYLKALAQDTLAAHKESR